MGSLLSSEGKSARTVNGRAKATEKANIVMMGCQKLPPDMELIRTLPTMGPVQEKETSTRVSAMKKMPPRPPLSDLVSVLFTSLLGIVMSNAPKNEAANIMNTMKKMIFGSQCVASQLNMSAVTASPPSQRVIMMSAAMGSV